MRFNKSYILIFLLSVMISSFSQILLKQSANNTHKSVMKEYLNFSLLVAYGLFFISSFLTVFAYKGVPMSLGPVLEASGYIWVTILSSVMLKETVTHKKCIGLCLIVFGILIFSIG